VGIRRRVERPWKIRFAGAPICFQGVVA
jgi:hypothetical protein